MIAHDIDMIAIHECIDHHYLNDDSFDEFELMHELNDNRFNDDMRNAINAIIKSICDDYEYCAIHLCDYRICIDDNNDCDQS